ncbi:MAG: winged helix-turn-helix domain-containing protein [Kiritimatiellia bacterium]
MVFALSTLFGDCCSPMRWVCECFPCTCIKCCCVYGAAALGAVFAILGVVRVVVGKERVEVVGGDERTRAEIAALLAKAHYPVSSVAAERWQLGTATVDVARQTVTTSEGVVSRLTGKELKILRLFSVDPKAVVAREAILASVWGLRYWGTTRTVDQHIAQLRKKLGVDILSVRGVGYRLAD